MVKHMVAGGKRVAVASFVFGCLLLILGSEVVSARASSALRLGLGPDPLIAAPGDTIVTLNWDSVQGATSYTLSRSLSNGGAPVATFTVTNTGFIDSGLIDGTTYWYTVYATTGTGNLPPCTPVGVTPVGNIGGSGGGLTGEYSETDPVSAEPHFVTENDLVVDSNSTTIPPTALPQVYFPPISQGGGWSCRWTGYVLVPTTGSYYFKQIGDWSCTITVNGLTVYKYSSGILNFSNSITLTGGTKYTIVVSYFSEEPVGYAPSYQVALQWELPGNGAYVSIGQSYLFPAINNPVSARSVSDTRTGNSVQVNWTQGADSQRSGFDVYRGTEEGQENYNSPFTNWQSQGGTSYSLTDNTVSQSVQYFYTVRTAYNNLVTNDLTLSTPSAEAPTSGFYFPPPVPNWMEVNQPTDSIESEGNGASYADSVELSSGEERHSPAPDIVAYNPFGVEASYQRWYRSSEAYSGTASPGLTAGWFDNYSYSFTSSSPNTWSALTLTYPNGSTETYTPPTSVGQTTVTFTGPVGAPYVLEGLPGSTTGSWQSLTLCFSGLTQWTFLPVSGTNGLYELASVGNSAVSSQAISVVRNANNSVKEVDNSASTAILSFGYDGNGHLQSVTDSAGRQVQYNFGAAAGTTTLLSVSTIVPTGTMNPPLQWEYGYTAMGGAPFLTTVSAPDPSNPGAFATHTNNYDPISGKVSGTIDGDGNTKAISYSLTDASITAKSPSGASALTWDATFQNRLATGLIDFYGASTHIAYGDPSNPGRPTSYTNRNNQTVSIKYDQFGNVVSTTDLRSVKTTYTYNYGTLTWPTGLLGSVQQGSKTATTFYYDGLGRLYQVWEPTPGTSGGPQILTRQYGYTAAGNVQTVEVPSPYAPGATLTYTYGYGTPEYQSEPASMTVYSSTQSQAAIPPGSYTYDNIGDVASYTDQVGNTTGYMYNESGQITQITYPIVNGPQAATTQFHYDHDGGTETYVRQYDENGVMISEQDYASGKEAESEGVSGNIETTQTIRDAIFRFAGVKDGNSNEVGFTFDAANHPVAKTYPLGDGFTVSPDAEGNPLQRTDGLGRTTTYNLATDDSRPLSETYPDGSTATFTYDQYDRLLTMTDSTETTTYAYDDLDNVTSVQSQFTGVSGTYIVSYVYKPDGSRDTMTTPAGTYHYYYDVAGRLSQVVDPWATQHTQTYNYYDNGLIKESKNFGFDTTFTYNPRSFLSSQTTVNSLGGALQLGWSQMQYDAFGDLVTANISYPPSAGTDGNIHVADYSGSLTLYYDAQFRPKEEKWVLSSTGQDLYDHSWTTDPAGNPTSVNGTTFTYNNDDQIKNSGYVWDNNGNPTSYVLSGSNVTLTWGFENDLTSVPAPGGGTLTAAYRADGKRAWKKFGSQSDYFLYDGDQVTCELTSSGSVYAAYGYGPDGLSERNDAGGAVSYAWDPFGNVAERFNLQINKLDPATEAVYDTHGAVVFDISTNTNGPAPIFDAVAGRGRTDWSDEQLRASGMPGLQLVGGESYYDPSRTRNVNRWGMIRNEYESDIFPWKVISGIARGFCNSYFSSLADMADMNAEMASGLTFGLVKPAKVPMSWRKPAGEGTDKLDRVSELMGSVFFTGVSSIDAGALPDEPVAAKINSESSMYEGFERTHPVTGVPFEDGNPVFDYSYAVYIQPTGSRRLDRIAANKIMKQQFKDDGKRWFQPIDMVWHHDIREYGRMELVDETTHALTGHYGGFWKY